MRTRDSAKGSAVDSRNINTQALFSLRGVPLNAFGVKLDKVLLNEEFNGLTRILGCNIGERFDINKLKYDKIIIMADSDSDGFNITSLVSAFFLFHMPEIVKQGKLFKAVSPLYKIKNKEKEFILNKKEYIQIFEKSVRKNMRVALAKDKKILKDKEMQDMLMSTRYYLETLNRTATHLAVNPYVLEYICINRNEKDFYKDFHREFPELDIDKDNVMTGIYEGEYQILIMDRIFEKSIKELIELIEENKQYLDLIVYEVFNSKPIEKGLMTLGQFLALSQKFQPIIKTRYKGLGELGAADLRDTTLSPKNRILIRLTVEDIERDLKQFEILHGNNAEERKLMMEHYKISREDLDN